MLRHAAAAPRNFGGCEIVHGDTDSIGNATWQPCAVSLVGLAEMRARYTSGAVRVRGGNRDVIGTDTGMMEDERLGFVEERAVDEAVVDHDKGQPRRAVVERERPRVQLIVNIGGDDRRGAAVNLDTERWGDVRRGRPSTEAGGEGVLRLNRSKDEQAEGQGRKMKAET